MGIEWIIVIVLLIISFVSGIKKYIIDADCYDATGLLDDKNTEINRSFKCRCGGIRRLTGR